MKCLIMMLHYTTRPQYTFGIIDTLMKRNYRRGLEGFFGKYLIKIKINSQKVLMTLLLFWFLVK